MVHNFVGTISSLFEQCDRVVGNVLVEKDVVVTNQK